MSMAVDINGMNIEIEVIDGATLHLLRARLVACDLDVQISEAALGAAQERVTKARKAMMEARDALLQYVEPERQIAGREG